ncbi:winged helix-turn-helix domain-containing protein [Candidatus Woesearchaeota archaeon]|nr:winged helix-turn-helix domain-containing protein [Candidatus Woesearchaeota archaeon]
MKQAEVIYREILYQAIEKKRKVLTQADLARTLSISLSIINKAIQKLKNIGAIEVKQRNFCVVDIKKILYFWASIRNLHKDIIYSTRIEKSVKEIEKLMPNNIVFSSYSAYKFLFKDVPADYSEVYVYADLEEIKSRFPENKPPYNLFVLKKDHLIERYGKITTIANIFVDLWNLKEWYAKEFLKAMEKKMYGILE